MVSTMFGEFKVGEATAIAVILFVLVFFGTIAVMRLMKREPLEL
jgi:ABC-type sugar transport system permease subunit